jgi:hypothetical protein
MTHTHTDWRSRQGTGVALLLAAGVVLAGVSAYGQEMPTGPAARQVEALACAPRAVRLQPETAGVVQGSTEPKKNMFATGDTLLIGGFAEGTLAPGQQYYVRRTLPPHDRSDEIQKLWINVHTAGWIRIISVDGARAQASVTYVCDSIDPNDYLVPFEVPVVPQPLMDERDPDFESPGEVLFGVDRRANQGGGSYIAVDRGTDDGVRAGQHVVFFRREGAETTARTLLGTGLVVEARSESATVLIQTATQPIYSGDAVAFRR